MLSKVHFRVTNTGSVSGTETAQVYVPLPASAGEPSKRLLGRAKVCWIPVTTATW